MLADLAEEHDALAERYRANGGEGKALSERKAALDAEDAVLAHDLRSPRCASASGRPGGSESSPKVRPRPMSGPCGRAARPTWPPDWPPGITRPPSALELAKAEAELAEIGYDTAGA